ncbi:hypothetical protein OH492_28345 [Vibrio chagasii]|nr:hypothetical protein [Vibrio chagasii]
MIEANKEVPLLPALGQSVGQGAVNPHTPGLSTAIQRFTPSPVKSPQLDPDNAAFI